ncbi:MAG: Gfo/Idh/MocA family oxidoreductase, partial [Anaerolineae bacterium]|nr:Gfo/Idh/MocA family oxidoreductase [Gemmatimonadaceae bacterium]
MNKPLRVAVAGSGKMGRHHAIAIQRLAGRANLVAVADSDHAYAKALAAELNVSASYGGIEELLQRERPDVVHICTAPASHTEIALAALAANAHIYVEKPFAEAPEDARRILALARKQGRRVCAGHQLLFERPTILAEQVLAQIGRIQHVESYFAFRQPRRADGRTPMTAREQLLDILPHPVYLLLHFLGADADDAPAVLEGVRADERGAVHALVSCGDATGVLVATLHGRPVDSYVRIVGTRGALTLDYVRGIVIPQLGAGSTIDKILDPYQRALATAGGSTGSLARRFLKKQRSYPGLAEAFASFYAHIDGEGPAPVAMANIERTVALCDQVRMHLDAKPRAAGRVEFVPSASVAVTGGTGMLGRAVVAALGQQGVTPLVIARRLPAEADQHPNARYLVADLGVAGDLELPASVDTVIHCAAETAGGYEAHQRNSIDATLNLLNAMAASGARKLVHVSSLAVIDMDAKQPLSENSPLEREGRRRGPYVWGKLESEKIAREAAQTHGIDVRIVRPGALVDREAFAPPGKLGR